MDGGTFTVRFAAALVSAHAKCCILALDDRQVLRLAADGWRHVHRQRRDRARYCSCRIRHHHRVISRVSWLRVESRVTAPCGPGNAARAEPPLVTQRRAPAGSHAERRILTLDDR